VPRKVTA